MEELTLEDVTAGNFPVLDHLTNIAIRHLFDLASGAKLSTADVLDWMKQIYSKNGWPWNNTADSSVLIKLVKIKNWKNVKKSLAHKEQFLATKFTLPVLTPVKPKRKNELKPKESKRLRRVEPVLPETEKPLVKTYLAKHIKYERKQKKKRLQQLLKENRRLLKSRGQCDHDNCPKVKVLEEKLFAVRSQKHSLKHYYKNKLKTVITPSPTETDKCRAEKDIVSQLQYENGLLKEKIDSLQEKQLHVIPTKLDGKTYNDKVRQTIYTLASKQVAVGQISPVIRTVVENMTEFEIYDLPDVTTVTRIVKKMMMGEISRAHMNEVLCDKNISD